MISCKVINQLKPEGKLKKYGYFVSGFPYNMSDKQRQYILQTIVSDEKMSVREIEEYLKMLIRLNGKSLKQKIAVQKWKRDLAYIEQKYDDGSVQVSIGDFE